jgi:CheY-like chemotaxis protein
MISIHLVGNDPILSEILQHYRKDTGENIVDIYLSGLEALTRLSQRPGDVVIMTYSLPDMDASQFLSRLRKINRTIPCIIFTEEGQKDLLLPAGSGIVYLLQKKEDLRDQCTAIGDIITRVLGDRRDELPQIQNDRLLSALAECTLVLLQEKTCGSCSSKGS